MKGKESTKLFTERYNTRGAISLSLSLLSSCMEKNNFFFFLDGFVSIEKRKKEKTKKKIFDPNKNCVEDQRRERNKEMKRSASNDILTQLKKERERKLVLLCFIFLFIF